MKFSKRVNCKIFVFSIICFLITYLGGLNVKAYEKETITIDDINSSETITVYISPVTIIEKDDSSCLFSTRTYGNYPIYTRLKTEMSSSNGLVEKDSIFGTYSSIASVVLTFIPGIAGMTVSQIFNVVGMAVNGNSYTQAKTFYSYVQYLKLGQAKWSDDPGYANYVTSGKRNYYKHVLSGKRGSNGQWTTETRDYLESPAYVMKGLYYDKSVSWFKEQARQRIANLNPLIDLPW